MSRLSVDTARELLDYDPITGRLTWRVSKGTKAAGTEAGSLYPDGNGICVVVNRVHYKAHRLAWLIMTGRWPKNGTDHVNGNPYDNSWTNLREATQAENMQNLAIRAHNTSGYPGVSWNRKLMKWQVTIKKNGKSTYLGLFECVETAAASYLTAKRKFHTYNPTVRTANG